MLLQAAAGGERHDRFWAGSGQLQPSPGALAF